MAQAGESGNSLPSLFSELHRYGENGDYERALKVANKILHDSPDEEKAFHCKVVCFIQLGQFEDALQAIKKNNKFSGSLLFEKAYSEYRLNRIEEALRTIKSVSNPDDRIRELHGQVLYRLENYTECLNIYKDLVKNTQDDFEEERQTNLSAVLAALHLWGSPEVENLPLKEDTYELCYNSGCALIGQKQYTAALEKLKCAEELCRKAHEDDGDVNSEECEAELSIIWVQMGYALQKVGQIESALRLYNQVMKQRPSDQALAAVASNNIITINKEQNVFDSKKKMKVATAENLKQKLTWSQRKSIAMNECLLYMYTGQSDQCKRLAQTLHSNFPDSDVPSLIESAQYVREKNLSKAIECLENRSGNGTQATRMKLALAQLYLSHEHIFKACDVLRSIATHCPSPGLISALVTLYASQEDKESAADVLRSAIDWYHANDPQSTYLSAMVRANANFHLQSGSAQVAVQMLEELHRQNSSDLKTLAQLITAYSKFDPQKAHMVSKKLPSVDNIAKDVDVDSLEASLSQLSSKYIKKGTTTSPRAASGGRPPGSPLRQSAGDVVVVKKKRKKNKKVLPKNFDPNVTPDPERWLPLRERSYYRGKRRNKKGNMGKGGTQGTMQPSSDLDISKSLSPTTSQTNATSSSPPVGPAAGSAGAPPPSSRQQPPQAAAAGAKQRPKKKKGVKW